MDLQIAIRTKNKPDQIVFLSNGRSAVFGRGTKAAFQLDDPYVSETHLCFASVGNRWSVTDLASKHGTIVDGVRYGGRAARADDNPGDTALLMDHHAIRIGATILDVHTRGPHAEFCDRFDAAEMPAASAARAPHEYSADPEPFDLLNTLAQLPLDSCAATTEYDLLGLGRTEPIGKGPLGIYRKATELLSGKVLAVKSVDCTEAPAAAMAKVRAALARRAQLRDPAVQRICRVDFRDGSLHIGSAFIEGEDLASFTRKCGGRIPLQLALDLFTSALDGLAALHSADLLHLGIKPANILITPANKAVLLDAGVAAELAGARIVSAAPLADQATPEKTSDFLSLCAVFLEAMSGAPFPKGAWRQHEIQSAVPGMSDAVARVFESSKRYSSASELKAALAAARSKR